MEPTKSSMTQKRMAIIQSLASPVKDKDAYKYKYADLAQVLGMVKEAAKEHGCCVLEGLSTRESESVLTLSLSDEDGNEALLAASAVPNNPDPQYRGSWITYMRRYHLLTAFSMAPDDDDGITAKARAAGGVEGAKQVLWAAVKSYAASNNEDPKAIIAGIQGAADYRETSEYLLETAKRYRA